MLGHFETTEAQFAPTGRNAREVRIAKGVPKKLAAQYCLPACRMCDDEHVPTLRTHIEQCDAVRLFVSSKRCELVDKVICKPCEVKLQRAGALASHL